MRDLDDCMLASVTFTISSSLTTSYPLAAPSLSRTPKTLRIRPCPSSHDDNKTNKLHHHRPPTITFGQNMKDVFRYLVGISLSTWQPQPLLPVAAAGRPRAVGVGVAGDAARGPDRGRCAVVAFFFFFFAASSVRAVPGEAVATLATITAVRAGA